MRRDIEFPGFGGTVLRGWLYVPEGSRPAPAVVMAHGFSAVKEMALDRYAEVFCTGGMTVLVFDHRNLGASDGEPRQEINPWAQSRDYRAAIGWLAEQPEADAHRIGIWGSSFSGGEVIVVGACDERVGAIVATVPMAGLPGVEYADTTARFLAIRSTLLDESEKGLADHGDDVLGPMAVVPEDGVDLPPFLNQPEAAKWFLRAGKEPGSRWRNRVTLCNAFTGEPNFDPGACIGHVSPTPLLLVVATEDNLAETPVALEAFERAAEPKRIELIVGDHFAVYDGDGFARSSTVACDFLLQHLGKGATAHPPP